MTRDCFGRSWSSLAVMAVFAASVGCSDGSGGRSLRALGVDDGANAGASTSALLSASKASTLRLDTGAKLVVPQGSVVKDTQVELRRPADKEALPLIKTVPAQYKVASAPYVVTPHGTSFNKELELELPIAQGKSNGIVVARLDDEDDDTWDIEPTDSLSSGTAKVNIRHFSVYVLLERKEGAGQVPSSGTFKERLVAKLKSCGLVRKDGKYNDDWEPTEAVDVCEANCVLNASCSDFEAEACGASSTSASYRACLDGCDMTKQLTCEDEYGDAIEAIVCDGYDECFDGADEQGCPATAFLACEGLGGSRVPAAAKCDGYEDCDDGSDEAGCPASLYFVCKDGDRMEASAECDGYEDCVDGSDEDGCSYFACKDGSDEISLGEVCDLYEDCLDGSDEAQGCLQLTCELGSIEDDSSLLSSRKSRRR